MQTRVLVVEDDLALAQLAKFHLEQLHASVEHAENGQVALEKASQNVYDLVLMDMEMPVMTGFESVRELRKRGYLGIIVATTALTQPVDQMRCIEAGCDQYIPKPFSRHHFNNLLAFIRTEPLLSGFCHDAAMASLIESFLKELPHKIRSLEQAVTEGDAQSIEIMARALKGQGGSFGFQIISDAARQVESDVQEGATSEQILKDVDSLVKLCLQACTSFRT